jgi:hypothetical protein
MILTVLNALELSDSFGITPFVDFREAASDAQYQGHLRYLDAAAKKEGKNLWEYFLEPVSEWHPSCPGDVVSEDRHTFDELHDGKRCHQTALDFAFRAGKNARGEQLLVGRRGALLQSQQYL